MIHYSRSVIAGMCIVKDLEDTFETIEYISVVDLETNTEIKRHVIT